MTDLLTEGAYESRVWIDDVLLQDKGITVLLSSDEPALPSMRNVSVSVPGRHGAYDFGAYLEPREFTLNCVFPRQSYTDLKRHIREFNQLFVDEYGRPKTVKLRFGDEVDKFYNVRLTGGIPVERVAERGFITINLTAFDPYAYASAIAFDQEPIEYDNGYEYDTGLMYPNTQIVEWKNTIQLAGVHNYSYYATPLNIVIAGKVINPKVTINGKTTVFNLTLNEQERLTINSESMLIFKEFNEIKTNMYQSIRGDFLFLNEGDNHIIFEGGTPNATINISWKHKFI